MEIGTRLARLRKEKGLTQAELAKQLYVSSKTVSKWENGYGYPDIEILPRIAAALGVDTDFLLTGKTRSFSVSEKSQTAEPVSEEEQDTKGVFRLFLWQATLNNYSFWMILLSVLTFILALVGGPVDVKAEEGYGTYTVLAFLYRSITDGIAFHSQLDGWLIALEVLWILFFVFLFVLLVWEIYVTLHGANEYFVRFSAIRFAGAAFLYVLSFLYGMIFNRQLGEIYIRPNILFSLLFFCTLIQLLLNILTAKHKKSIRLFKRFAALGVCACIVCCFVFCILPRNVVATKLDETSLELSDWDLQASKNSASANTDFYNVESLLSIRANSRIEQIVFVAGDAMVSQTSYIEHNVKYLDTRYDDGAYYNFFEIDFSVHTQGEAELPAFEGTLLLYDLQGQEYSRPLKQSSMQLLQETYSEYGFLYPSSAGLDKDVSDREFEFFCNTSLTFTGYSERNGCDTEVFYALGIYLSQGSYEDSGEILYLWDGFEEQTPYPQNGTFTVPVCFTKSFRQNTLTKEGAFSLRLILRRVSSLRPYANFVFMTDKGEFSFAYRLDNEFLIKNHLSA